MLLKAHIQYLCKTIKRHFHRAQAFNIAGQEELAYTTCIISIRKLKYKPSEESLYLIDRTRTPTPRRQAGWRREYLLQGQIPFWQPSRQYPKQTWSEQGIDIRANFWYRNRLHLSGFGQWTWSPWAIRDPAQFWEDRTSYFCNVWECAELSWMQINEIFCAIALYCLQLF